MPVIDLQIGFKAFDPHELLLHFIAHEAGLYAAENLRPRLVDTSFPAPPTEAKRHEGEVPLFSVACGAALLDWLRGEPVRLILAGVKRPMFWLYAREHGIGLSDLLHRRIAGYPTASPPATFLRLILKKAGIAPQSVSLSPVRDDTARLGLLEAGDVDAAVVSSACLPPQMAERGLWSVAFFGDELRLPTTGLALCRELSVANQELATTMLRIYRLSLEIVHSDSRLLQTVLERNFRIREKQLDASIKVIRHCFTTSNHCRTMTGQTDVEAIAQEAGVVSRDLRDFLLPDLIGG